MFCSFCGREIPEGSRFCPACGQALSAGPEVPSPAPQTPFPPVPQTVVPSPTVLNGAPLQPERRRRGKGPILAAGAVLLAAAVAAGVFFSGVLSSPRDRVGRAAAKSLSSWSDAADSLGLPDWETVHQQRSTSQTFSVRVKDLSSQIDGGELWKGAGLELTSDMSVPDRRLRLSAAATYGSARLAGAQLDLQGTELFLSSPEFLGSTVLGLDTETLGRDLARLGAGAEYEDVGFDLFDFLEVYTKPLERDPELWASFLEKIAVEKGEKDSQEVNGRTLSGRRYPVTIPEDALLDLLDGLEDQIQAQDYDGALTELLRSMGVPGDQLDEIRQELRNSVNGGPYFDALERVVRELGDLELDVFVSGGYVSAVEWEGELWDAQAEAGLYLGGGEEYVDDLSLTLESESGRLRLTSSGDHRTRSGTFTDETVLKLQEGVTTTHTLKSELSFAPQGGEDNFSWTVKLDDFSLSAQGRVQAGEDRLEADLEKVSASAYGAELFTLELSCSVKPYAAPARVEGARMLADFSLTDLLELARDLQANSRDWLADAAGKIPALAPYVSMLSSSALAPSQIPGGGDPYGGGHYGDDSYYGDDAYYGDDSYYGDDAYYGDDSYYGDDAYYGDDNYYGHDGYYVHDDHDGGHDGHDGGYGDYADLADSLDPAVLQALLAVMGQEDYERLIGYVVQGDYDNALALLARYGIDPTQGW